MVKYNLLTIVVFLAILNVLLLTVVVVKVFKKPICPSMRNFGPNERIVGGHPVGIEKFRFVAGIIIVAYKEIYLQCGASILSPYWVISAAHCIDLLKEHSISTIYVASGHNEWKKGVRHKVIRMIKHEDFDQLHLTNDIALFEVKEPFNASLEAPITLAGSQYSYETNSSATVIGWGVNVTDGSETQNTLVSVDVVIFSKEFCDKWWKEGSVTADMFCAGDYEGGRDACQFDSGGPIVQKGILIGIISWGGECGNKEQPGVYTKMSYFIPWLKSFEAKEKIELGYSVRNSSIRT